MKKIGIISGIIILLDQLIKIIITKVIELNTHVIVLDKFFYIANVHNEGAAFSILSGSSILLISIGIIAIIAIYFLFIKNKILNKIDIIIYGLLIGGIVGNLIDRVVFNYVIDYLEFIIFKYHYPIFNLADICIVVSVILMIIINIKEEVCKRLK